MSYLMELLNFLILVILFEKLANHGSNFIIMETIRLILLNFVQIVSYLLFD